MSKKFIIGRNKRLGIKYSISFNAPILNTLNNSKHHNGLSNINLPMSSCYFHGEQQILIIRYFKSLSHFYKTSCFSTSIGFKSSLNVILSRPIFNSAIKTRLEAELSCLSSFSKTLFPIPNSQTGPV